MECININRRLKTNMKQQCLICDEQNEIIILSCRHSYCEACFNAWYKHNYSKPICCYCRKPFDILDYKNLIKIYETAYDTSDLTLILNNACYIGNFELVKYLHSIGIECSDDAMDISIENGHISIVEFLHSIGEDYSYDAIYYACKYGYYDIVQFLHSIDADFTEEAMDIAVENGHISIVEFLDSIGVSYDREDAIERATILEYKPIIEFLTQLKIN